MCTQNGAAAFVVVGNIALQNSDGLGPRAVFRVAFDDLVELVRALAEELGQQEARVLVVAGGVRREARRDAKCFVPVLPRLPAARPVLLAAVVVVRVCGLGFLEPVTW